MSQLFAAPSVSRDLARGKYLSALRRLGSAPIPASEDDWTQTVRLWALNAVDPWAQAWPLSGAGRPRPDGLLTLSDPATGVAAAIATHRVVVLMEAHRWPETRYFGAHLLADLCAAGATHLAFETSFQAPLSRFARNGICRPNSAVYAFDPSRAAILRTARALGLQLVAFDIPPGGHLWTALARLVRRHRVDAETTNRERERAMAETIVRRIVRRDPAARVVVWTGEQHAMKRTPDDWPWKHPFMAAHLGQMLGEEPFCVWQEAVDWPELTSGPRLLSGNHPWLRRRGVDAMVLHHRGPSPHRPEWLDQGKVALEIATDGAELVQAFPEREGPRAVPVEQWLTHHPTLHPYLPAGRYLLRGIVGADEIIWQRPLAVTRLSHDAVA